MVILMAVEVRCWFVVVLFLCGSCCCEAVWTCGDPESSKSNSTAAAGRNSTGCSTRYEVPGAQEQRSLEAALDLDPLAEYKYHFECQNPPPDESPGLLQRTRTDLQDCEAGPYPLRIPGINKMQYGYNVITDKLSSTTAHTPVLDVLSTERFNATIIGPDSKCYVVPDAFVSSSAIGVVYSSSAATGFVSIGTNSVGGFRDQLVSTRAIELGLREPGFEEAAWAAALSGAESVSRLAQMAAAAGRDDVSETWQLLELASAQIQTPIPTDNMVGEWKKLRAAGSSPEAYHNYFNEFGTHYFLSAVIGGRFNAVFTTNTSLHRPGVSPQERADCIAAKAGQLAGAGGGRSISAACALKYDDRFVYNTPPGDLVALCRTDCDGGIKRTCPRQLGETNSKWAMTVSKNPAVLLGHKRWITRLLEHIVEHSGERAGIAAEQYKKIVAELGGAEEMKKFAERLKFYLLVYLRGHKFCADASACPPVRIPGLPEEDAHTVQNDGETFWRSCPHGEIAFLWLYGYGENIREKRLIQWVSSKRLHRVGLECSPPPGVAGHGDRGRATRLMEGMNTREVRRESALCNGTLTAYKLLYVEDDSAEWRFSSRVHDLRLLCVVDGEAGRSEFEIPQSLPYNIVINVETGERWSEWKRCPQGYAICAFRAINSPVRGVYGFVSINFRCCYYQKTPF